MPRRRIVFLGGVTLAVVLVGVALGVFLTDARSAEAFSVISCLAGIGAFVVALAQRGPAPAISPAAQLDSAADQLAEMVEAQWNREAAMRMLHQPDPLELRWRETRRPISAAPSSVFGGTITGQPWRLEFEGGLADNVDKFYQLPRRQLVVIGEPGAGKTVFVLLLVLGLLRRRRDGDTGQPVPVLLPVLSWDPTTEQLDTWLIRRIREDYPPLRDETLYGPDAPRRLVEGRRVLPVLDGLDEMPPPRQAEALTRIGLATGNRPLVVTCRTAEYSAAVHQGGVLGGAAVIELEPILPSDAAIFLRSGSPAGSDRWEQVLARMAEPTSPLAAALSSPLTVSLARAEYRAPGTNPAELLDTARFPSSEAIESHLLDSFITTVYAQQPPPAHAGQPTPPTPRWTAAQAQRWLGFLATHLDRLGTRNYQWWSLHLAIPRRAGRAAFVTVIGITGFLVAALDISVAVNLHTGLIAALAIGGACTLTAVLPAYLGTLPGPPVQAAIRFGRVGGARETIRSALTGGLAPGIVVGVVTTLVSTATAGVILGSAAGLAGAIIVGLIRWSSPAEQATAATPSSVLRADRRNVATQLVINSTALGTVIGLAFGHGHSWQAGLLVGATGGTALAFGFISATAWMWYQVAHAWLALRGRLPWHLIRFLDDAHYKGVLRQAGSVYQFRHGRLQDHLARTRRNSNPQQKVAGSSPAVGSP